MKKLWGIWLTEENQRMKGCHECLFRNEKGWALSIRGCCGEMIIGRGMADTEVSERMDGDE